MTGADLLKLKDDLGLTDEALARIIGLQHLGQLQGAYQMEDEHLGTPGVKTAFTPLMLDILGELWRRFDRMQPDQARGVGRQIAEGLHVHGPGFVVWWIMNKRCSRWKDEEGALFREAGQ